MYHRSRNRLKSLISVSILCIGFAGCASAPLAGGERNDDPLEPLNRRIFYVNRVLDGVIIKPAAEIYRGIVPRFVQDRFRNILNNLAEVRILANNLLQGRMKAAGTTFSRFALNSTAGVAGMFDIATKEGLERQTGDFGQTLHGWGFGQGIYLVLPIFGPSNVRDAVGLGVDFYTTAPGPYLPHSSSDAVNAVRISDGVDLRSRNIEALALIEESALDFYSQLKSIVQQRRQVDLREVRPVDDAADPLRDPAAPATPEAPTGKQSIAPAEIPAQGSVKTDPIVRTLAIEVNPETPARAEHSDAPRLDTWWGVAQIADG